MQLCMNRNCLIMPDVETSPSEVSSTMLLYILAIVCLILILFVWFRSTGTYFSIMNILNDLFSFMYSCQGKVQSLCRPGVWLPFIRNFHRATQKWVMTDPSSLENKEIVLAGIMNLISQEKSGQKWRIDKIETLSQANKKVFVRIFVYTWAKWLDIIEMTFSGEEVEVRSFSSGVLPLSIPFACFFNVLLCWIPFYDRGLNKKRLRSIVQILGNEIVRVEKI